MFSAPRFVVVDDKKPHLDSILLAFQQLGTPCMGLHFKADAALDKNHFRGVRCLFLDLHLIDGQAGSDNKRHYAVIASILEDNIHQTGGPFVLVVWTEHPQLSDELRDYLDAGLDANKPHARPLAVLCLAKDKFINTETGVPTKPEDLKAAVAEAVASTPQLGALLSWETEVMAAAGDTLASLLGLVPPGERTSKNFPSAVDTILSRLARETVGSSHVELDHRAALTQSLAPILTDRIMNQAVQVETKELWKKAVTRYEDRTLGAATPAQAGEVNRMLHLAVSPAESITPVDWGAVVEWPFGAGEEMCLKKTGIKTKQMYCNEFKLASKSIEKCRPVLVRIGAACDYAQNRHGLITYLLGVEVPEGAEWQVDGKGNRIGLPNSIWTSPVFAVPGTADPFRLYVHFRFPFTQVPDECKDWGVRYRLREQLLMHLISTESSYVARPGIVQLPAE